ncbi:MAG: hypothetical protein NT026_02720, partial [Candidatus Staskawiczbacteria bacterium]|nr:hypothetical protein [Candidatus Staskawiczbacteria bacterium]
MKKQGRENKNQKVKKVQTKPEAFVSKPAVKPAVKVVAMSVNRVPTPARLRARFAKYQLFPPRPAYAEGFGPDPKLAKFFKTPISPKIAGLVSLFAAVCLVALTGTFVFTS